MKQREEVARFVERQLSEDTCKREKGHKHHYGMQELRELLDFIYEGRPANEGQMVMSDFLSRAMKPYVYTGGPPCKPYEPPADTSEIDAAIIARLSGQMR